LYRELHNIGYRCSMDVTAFMREFTRIKVKAVN